MEINQEILKVTGANSIIQTETVQSLWSGYGKILRYFLKGGEHSSIIVKHIEWPDVGNHPRGWNTDLSHQRKLKSYQVEKNWYASFAGRLNANCRVPLCLHALEKGNEIWLILEDLNASGYHIRLDTDSVALIDVKNCLTWLAGFHAKFMNEAPEGLWATGTYWHLATRPDELDQMQNVKLKQAAEGIDRILSNAQFQTLVHGDAKLANFCFNNAGEVAAVDFQYVGRGCGIKDVAYLISSCFDDKDCEIFEDELLSHYFDQLELALNKSTDFQLVKDEWFQLYKYAWADFHRFLDGWSPGHWKIHGYSERLANVVIQQIAEENG